MYGYIFLIILTSRWSDLENSLIRLTYRWYYLKDLFDVPLIWSLGFADSFDVPRIWCWGLLICLTFMKTLVMIWPLADLSGWSNIQVSLDDDLHVLIGPSGGSSILGSVGIIIRRCSRNSLSDSYLGVSLLDPVKRYITWCSNITMHYSRSVVVINYVQRLLRVIWV